MEESNNTILGFGIIGIISVIIISLVILYFIAVNFKPIVSLFSSTLLFIPRLFTNLFKNNTPLVGAENCAIVQGTGQPVSRIPSAYIAHIAFFFGFLFTNAYYTYTMDKETDASDELYENRRNRSIMIMTVIVALFSIIVLLRYNLTNCESQLGILLTTTFFGLLGLSFYLFAEACGARKADVLGMITSFVPTSAGKPVVCAST